MQYSIKTRILNGVRTIGKIPVAEKFLVQRTQHKSIDNLFVKLIPNNYQYSKDTLRECERDGIRYLLDISDYMQYCIYYGIVTEPREKLYNLVKDSTTIIDVGTNIGETLLNFALMNPSGRNIGFEPVPFVYEKAKRNVDLNEFKNVIVENLALSNDESNLFFSEVNEFNSGGIYLTTEEGTTSSKRVVKAVRLDDYVEQNRIENISLLKIDVEGFEMNVIEGAKKTILHHRPILFVEVNDTFLRRQSSSASALIDFFSVIGYKTVHAETGQQVSSKENFQGKHFDVICSPA